MASSATRLWGSSLSSMPLTMDARSLAPCFLTCKARGEKSGPRGASLAWGLAGTRPLGALQQAPAPCHTSSQKELEGDLNYDCRGQSVFGTGQLLHAVTAHRSHWFPSHWNHQCSISLCN